MSTQTAQARAAEPSRSTRGTRRTLLLAAIPAGAAGAVVAVFGGDHFRTLLDAAWRARYALPLYTGQPAVDAVIGPPSRVLFFVPAALLRGLPSWLPALAWYLFSLACLFAAIRLWSGGISRALNTGRSPAPPLASAQVLVPLMAVAVPAGLALADLDLAVILLAAAAAGARSLLKGEDRIGGVLLGIAAGLEPALLVTIPWLLARRMWRVAAHTTAVSAVVTLAALVRYGAGSYVGFLQQWLRTPGALPLPLPAGTAIGMALVWLVFVWRKGGNRQAVAPELAVALMLALLHTSHAGLHAWVLAFPAFFASWTTQVASPPSWGPRRYAFTAAALLAAVASAGRALGLNVILVEGASLLGAVVLTALVLDALRWTTLRTGRMPSSTS